VSLAQDRDYSELSISAVLENRRVGYVVNAEYSVVSESNIMGTQAPGSEPRRKDPNSQGTSSPSQDRNKSGQMEQQQRDRQNQQGGSQRQDKENDRSKSGAQRPD
jgi:hypothetical protein